MSGTIRVLGPADVEEYRTIRLATLECEPDFFGSAFATEAARPIGDFAAMLEASMVFGACGDGMIAGVIRYRRGAGAKERHKGSIGGFFVRPDRRREGLGAALMTAVLAAARGQVEHVTLNVVQANTAAIALYRRFGFVPYGLEPRARKDGERYFDLVQMILPLGMPPPHDR